MEGSPAKRSSIRTLVYLVIIAVTVLLILELTGAAEVVSKSQQEELIDRPHAE